MKNRILGILAELEPSVKVDEKFWLKQIKVGDFEADAFFSMWKMHQQWLNAMRCIRSCLVRGLMQCERAVFLFNNNKVVSIDLNGSSKPTTNACVNKFSLSVIVRRAFIRPVIPLSPFATLQWLMHQAQQRLKGHLVVVLGPHSQ